MTTKQPGLKQGFGATEPADEVLSKFRFMVEKSNEEAYLVQPDGKIAYANEAAAGSLGYTIEEMLQLRVADFDPIFGPRFMDHFQDLKDGLEVPFETIHVTKDGRKIEKEIKAVCLSIGKNEFICGFGRNISELKRAEKALNESERVLREHEHALHTISNNLVNGMIYQVVRLADGRRKFTYLSERVKDFYGITPEQGMADPNLIYGRVHPEEVDRVITEEELANQTLSIFKTEVRMITPDNGIRWSFFVSRPRLLDDGSTCWDGIEFDITERKNSEAEKDRLQQQLTQAQKMESIGRLAGGIAHDFNNMLGVIIGYADVLLQKIPASDPSHEKVQEIKNVAGRSADLASQLLAFARKQTIFPRVLDLNEGVEGTLRMLRRLIGENIDLVWLPGKDLRNVKIDPSQINQVLANLCVNARDAISGIGRVIIETGNVAFGEASTTRHPDAVPGDYVMLSVRDTGCGLKKEDLMHLFEPFYTTKEAGLGTGLGLATVYGIIKQNSGFVDVSSDPGMGTTFRLFFPALAAGVVPVLEEEPKISTQGGSETILLVEDETSLLGLAELLLKELGYKVIAVETPEAALGLAEETPEEIDLLMTDVVMPGMNGRELAQRILSLNPDLRVLFTSGYPAEVIARQGILEKGVNFLQKPYSLENLAGKIRAVLERKEAPEPADPDSSMTVI